MVRETRHLWVGNLPHTIREERILDHFKRYGKVQSVKILPKKDEESGTCATVAFIDIKSAAKAHNADNKIDERTLKTDYYEPPASSTASSAIFIHERDDSLVRSAPSPYVGGRSARYPHGLSEERNYERPGHYYERAPEREPYLRRSIGMGYHDDDSYQGRAKSRDRYSRSSSGNAYAEGTERNQNHFRAHNARQHFEQQRYTVGDQYSDERDTATTACRLNRRTNATTASVVSTVASPTLSRSESRPRRSKRKSPSRSSGSRSNSRSRSRSHSSSGSRSSSSSSKLRSSSSDSSGRSRSPSKSRSPAASYGSQNNSKGSRLDRPASAITNPSSTVYLPSAVTTTGVNSTSTNSQSTIPSQGGVSNSNESTSEKDDKRPLGICVRNLPVRSTDTSLKDGLFHEYKKHGKVTMVKVIGQGTERYAVVCFKKPEDVDKALEVSKDKLFFGCKIDVTAHEGLDAEDNEFRPLEAELDEFHPKATRTLFIGNLEKDITTAELRKHFEVFGEIIEIDIKKQGTATSYAFIQYSDIASVVKAMRKLDGENLGANRIKLGFGKSMPTNCVWLDGIVDNISEKFLARHFNRFGPVSYTAVDREKGHALVFYDSVEFAQIAVSEMRGRILGGKKLQVDFASRECQTTFFDKLEMTGQMVPGERPWERRERRGEFDIRDDRDGRVGFENRAYARYESQSRAARGNFRGIQRAGFNGRGRGQGFNSRYEVYHDEFGERRHRNHDEEFSQGSGASFEDSYEQELREYGYCQRERRDYPSDDRGVIGRNYSPVRRRDTNSISPPPKERHHDECSNSPHLRSERSSSRGDKHEERLRERYISREESGGENSFDAKSDRMKYAEPADCLARKRNKARNSISDQESHHSQSPPRSRHHSRSISPPCKERKTLKDRLHHRMKSPSSRSSSQVNSPSREATVEEPMDSSTDYRDFRHKCVDAKTETREPPEINFPVTAQILETSHDGLEKLQQPKTDPVDPFRRRSVENESSEENAPSCDQLGQMERKKRLLASSSSSSAAPNKDISSLCIKSSCERLKVKTSVVSVGHCNTTIKIARLNCVPDAQGDEAKSDTESGELLDESVNEKPVQAETGNPELKYLQKKQVHLLHLLEQLREGAHSSDTEGSTDSDRLSNKKTRISCSDISAYSDSNLARIITKDECTAKPKSGLKDNSVFSRAKHKIEIDANDCMAISALDSALRKHLDPRKSFDLHAIPLGAGSSALQQKCQRIAVDKEDVISASGSQGLGETFLCVPSPVTPSLAWKKQCPNLTETFFPNNEDGLVSTVHIKNKENNIADDVPHCIKKPLQVTPGLPSPMEISKTLISSRSFPDGPPCHEIKRERDISPLSLPLPKFAACLRSPKSSPNPLMSPKHSSHSPRAGHSPSSFSAAKVSRMVETCLEIPNDMKIIKEPPLDSRLNGANASPFDAVLSFEPPNEITDIVPTAEPLLSPKSTVNIKERNNSSDSESRPTSPISQSIEERIRALDEKYNAWSGSTRTLNTPVAEPALLNTSESPLSTIKSRSRFSLLSPDSKPEPSAIVKSLLARTTIFDQDLKRLQHINEKYEPQVKMEFPPKVKTTFRTKAAAKEFSSPLMPTLQTCSPVTHTKLVSPLSTPAATSPPPMPLTPLSGNITLSPVTPSTSYYSQNSSILTACSPSNSTLSVPPSSPKNISEKIHIQPKDIGDISGLGVKHMELIKPKLEPESPPSSSTSVSVPHSLLAGSLTNFIKKEHIPPKENAALQLTFKDDSDIKVKKEPLNSANIPAKRDCTINSAKDQNILKDLNSLEHCKVENTRETHDGNDFYHKTLKEGCSQWKDANVVIKEEVDSSPNATMCPAGVDDSLVTHASKKLRVSSIDSNESDSGKSYKSVESNGGNQESIFIKQEKQDSRCTEPESKRPKLMLPKTPIRDRSPSPVPVVLKKCDKKDKNVKSEKCKSSNPKSSLSCSEKEDYDFKSNNKYDSKDRVKSDSSKIKEKCSKSRENKDSSSKREQKSKSREGKTEKDGKGGHSSNMKSKKEPSVNHSDKPRSEKKLSEKTKGQKSKSKQDFSFIEEEPVYFSMYDKVKARSSQNQTLKHQAKDLETMRQKFSRLKQSRAKREEKSKSIDDSDKDSDSGSRRSSESDTQARSSKGKQQRKRKLVIESSSDEDILQSSRSRISRNDKDFSDSASDSDCEFHRPRARNTSGNQSKGKNKKSDLIDSDSSGMDCEFPLKSPIVGKKKSKLKQGSEKNRCKIIKSEDEGSEFEALSRVQSKEKEHKKKKSKKEKVQEVKSENDVLEHDNQKKNQEESKPPKKKAQKEEKQETEVASNSSAAASKVEEVVKEKVPKDKKTDSVQEGGQPDEDGKHRSCSKKKKKSKKATKNKDKKQYSEKSQENNSKKDSGDTESKYFLPKLLSPKPNSPCRDKPLSPPMLQPGVLSDNDFKSDFSDFDFENNHSQDIDLNSELWGQLESKIASTDLEKCPKDAKVDEDEISSGKLPPNAIHSVADEESLSTLFGKMCDAPDNEIVCMPEEHEVCPVELPDKPDLTVVEKERDVSESSSYKAKNEKQDDLSDFAKKEEEKTSTDDMRGKEERRRKKSRKQHKEKKKKVKEDSHAIKENIIPSSTATKPSLSTLVLDTLPADDDSRLSTRTDEDLVQQARRLEQELMVASEETSTFGDDGPTKKEEKPVERRFEEEAAKETRRLEEELFSTASESWHMKEKSFDPVIHSPEIGSTEKPDDEIASLSIKDENIFVGLELHTSPSVDSAQLKNHSFLDSNPDSEQFKLEDKDIDTTNDIEDRRKIEDDMAVSALLLEMNSGEISAPELTKEPDYLEPLMDSHPEDTMNYLLPDESDNSLHIAENSPDIQVSESQDAKMESGRITLPPSPSSEPPALEISNIQDSTLFKMGNDFKSCETEPLPFETNEDKAEGKPSHSYNPPVEAATEFEGKPPVIDMPSVPATLEPVTGDSSVETDSKFHRKQLEEKPKKNDLKSENPPSGDETDNEQNSDRSENRLSHFEDITNDTADSKDGDDNPPVLQPVDSPRGHVCKTDTEVKSSVDFSAEVEEEQNVCDEISFPDLKNPDSSEVPDPCKQDDAPDATPELEKQDVEPTDLNLILNYPCSGAVETPDFDKPCVEESICDKPALAEVNDLTDAPDFENKLVDNSDKLVDNSDKLVDNSDKQPSGFDVSDDQNSEKEDKVPCISSVVEENQDNPSDNDQLEVQSQEPPELEEHHDGDTAPMESPKTQELNPTDLLYCPSPIPQSSEAPILDAQDSPKNITHDLCVNNPVQSSSGVLNFYQPGEESNDSEVTDSFDLEKMGADSIEIEDDIKPEEELEESNINEISNPKDDTLLTEELKTSCDEEKDSECPSFFSFPAAHHSTPCKEKDEHQNIDESQSDNSLPVIKAVADLENSDAAPLTPENLSKTVESDYLPADDNSNLFPVTDQNLTSQCKLDSASESEDPGFKKLKIGDVDSVSSDTIDTTISDLKAEPEVSEPAIAEPQIQEDTPVVNEIGTEEKPKSERPRRGRRPKTRKYTESTLSLPRYETSLLNLHSNPAPAKAAGKRGRQQSSERVRRSLRGGDNAFLEHSLTVDIKPVQNEIKCDSVTFSADETIAVEEASNSVAASDSAPAEVDNSVISSSTLGSTTCNVETKLFDKVSQPKEEPRRKRGRKKKASGEHQNLSLQCTEKFDSKYEEMEHSKDFHRPKERLWLSLSSEKEQKSSKENSSAYDVFEFRDSEDEELTFERDLQSHVKERLHENARTSSLSFEMKHETKPVESSSDKEKKTEEKQKNQTDDHELSNKEHVPEVNQHRKISITIRLHQKDGHDGTSAGTAEVVKTSEALNIDDTKSDLPKLEKSISCKQESTSSETPYNGPGKSTRKSTRLMNQAARSTVDEVIEEVVKGNFKQYSATNVESTPTRVTRRSRSNRRSEEAAVVQCENLEETVEDKTKNEPVFFILDNTVKDSHEKKNTVTQVASATSGNEAPVTANVSVSEPDKITDRIASLRSFRITRSTASKLESSKDISLPSNSGSVPCTDTETQRKESAPSMPVDEKKDTTSGPQAAKDISKNIVSLPSSSQQETTTCRPPLPVLKVELPRMVLSGPKEPVSKSEKAEENDDSDSRSSPAVLIDPVTGFLTPVNKNGESSLEMSDVSISSTLESKSMSDQPVSSLLGVPLMSTGLTCALKTSTIKNTNPSRADSLVSIPKAESSPCSQLAFSAPSPSPARLTVTPVGHGTVTSQPLSLVGAIATTTTSSSKTVDFSEASLLKSSSMQETETDYFKSVSAKPPTCTHVGVLTVCNPILTNTAAVVTTATITGSVKTLPSVSQSAVNTSTVEPAAASTGLIGHKWPEVSSSNNTPCQMYDKHVPLTVPSSTPSKSPRPSVTQVTTEHPPSRTIVTAVVTVASSGLTSNSLPQNIPKILPKCVPTTPVGLAHTSVLKAEVSHGLSSIPRVDTVCCTATKTMTSAAISSSSHSKNLSSNTDVSMTSSIAPVNTTWSNSKLAVGNKLSALADASVHQNATLNTVVSASKSESRTSQSSKSSHSHSAKNVQSFMQQVGFPVSAYEAAVHSNPHGLPPTSNGGGGGVIAELLQNPQLLQQHKDYFAAASASSSSQFQERIQGQIVRPATPVAPGIPPEIAARLGNPTPPHTPTPPVTSSSHSLTAPEMHPAHVGSGLHLRHATQSPLIVPPHPSLGIPPDLNVYVHQQIIYAASHPHYAALHPEIRAQQEAQARAAAALGMSPRFAYPPIPPTAVSSNSFRQPPEPRPSHSTADVKLETKPLSETSKVIHEQRTPEDKVQHQPIKPIRIKKEEKEMKVIHSDSRVEECDGARSVAAHEKLSSTAVAPQNVNLRTQHLHYPPAIRQISPHLTVPSHERVTDSPVVANLYASSQNRVPPIPVVGQIEDHKSETSVLSQSSHHVKVEAADIKPPVAHQTLPTTIPYHTLEPTVHPATRQPMLGVPQVGSPAPGYMDSRSVNQSAHSPGSLSYKKDPGHSQTNSLVSSHTPASEKRTNQELPKKVVHTRTLSHQGSSISPGPAGLNTAHSPLPWPPVIQPHSSHHSVAQSSHALLTPDQPSRRSNPHLTSQMGSEVPVHAPPPAHAMSQPTNVPRTLPQTPPHASQVPPHGDAFILQRYPVMWQGLLALKNDQAAVQMHFVSGNPRIARASLPPMIEGETAPVRIAQRMRLEQTQLEGVARKMQMMEEHCILMALPCGKDHMDVLQQSSNLKNGFINYLQLKQAAGIVNAAAPGTQQPAYVIHIFPSCEFSDSNLARIAPDLLHIICDITHLVIIIATV